MRPAQYIIVNKGAGMSPGKMAAQAAHAAVEGVRVTQETETGQKLLNLWNRGGHYMKLVMEVPDEERLRNAYHYITERGFKAVMIVDEGHTEVDPLTATAIGVEIVDKDWPHAAETFSVFRLYRDEQRGKKRRFWQRTKEKPNGTAQQSRLSRGGTYLGQFR
jgi:PTH2 family peptidyl-tRNA hydrolase